MRDRLQQDVAAEHAGPHTIGIIDETSDVKKGAKTPGVQKQCCAVWPPGQDRELHRHRPPRFRSRRFSLPSRR